MNWPPKWGTLAGESVSGYSPVASAFPQFPPTRSNQVVDALNQKREDYQQKNLLGFTTRELQDMDTITDRKLRPGDLRPRVHKLLERTVWERSPDPLHQRTTMYSIGKPAPFDGVCKCYFLYK